jgi:hypothetical protein
MSGEALITFSQAARQLPRRPAPSTFWRWRHEGVLINGRRIKLRCVRVGGQWYTTATAFADFLREQTAAALEQEIEPTDRPADTERRLASAGLL